MVEWEISRVVEWEMDDWLFETFEKPQHCHCERNPAVATSRQASLAAKGSLAPRNNNSTTQLLNYSTTQPILL